MGYSATAQCAKRQHAMLSVDKLAFERAGKRLFSDVVFEVEQGPVLKIHGPNGSGKTTLLRVLAGSLRPSEGVVRWHGEDAHRHPDAWRRSIAYLGPLNGISDTLSAVENLRFAAAFSSWSPSPESGSDRSEAQERQALKSVGLDGYRHAIVRGLSHGQKRRLAISRLLLARKPLWLLDEPAAPDDDSTDVLERCIAAHLERGGIVLMTTHRPINTAPAITRNVYFETSGRCSD
jgi:heme exporter protein A